MIVAGIEYEADAELFPDGSVHDATLARNTTIQGVQCAGGRSVVFFPSGRLKLCCLSDGVAINGIPCAAGRVVYFHENGRVLNASLGSECRINDRSLPIGTRVTFDESGGLLEYDERLERDAVLDGLPCVADFHIWRYANSRLSLVVLAKSHKIGCQAYPRRAQLSFDESGTVVGALIIDLDSGHQYRQRVFGVYEVPFE